MADEAQVTVSQDWFYREDSKMMGPFSESEIAERIRSGAIWRDTEVKKEPSISYWTRAEETVLRKYLDTSVSHLPQREPGAINNTIVWILAFAPIIGNILEYLVPLAIYRNSMMAQQSYANGSLWFITILLNIGLAGIDFNILKNGSVDTDRLKFMTILVPVYLYQRAKLLNQNLAYFIVWCAALVISMVRPF